MTGASASTSFPLALAFFFPAPEGREWFVFCTTDMGLFQVQPSRETWATICERGQREGGGCSQWDASPCVIVCSSFCPVIWRQAEIAWACLSAAVCFARAREGDVAVQHIYFITGFMWVVPPRWNTMAAPDTAHSHTVLAHWKSHKTRVVQGSPAVHDGFGVFLAFAGSHTANVVACVLKKVHVIT